ncbi:MAG: glycosyltransferase [Solirubrobacterales bacterium]|nr:glycosyltransferase [Solirubrobacterales bacterium]
MESRGRLLDERQRAATRWSIGQTATVDVVVPVTDEERALSGCLRVLRHYLREQLPCAWTITVVDDASTAGVRRVASEFAGSDHRIRVLHLDRRGRGHALRTG